MASYILPQVLVFQEFLRSATATAQPLSATILGEQYALNRYAVANEKGLINVSSTYNSSTDTSYLWPNRPAGGVVDQSYTKVFFDNALLRYFHHAIGVNGTVTSVSPYSNRIKASATVFAGANRSASLLRDVQAGDVVAVSASPAGSLVSYQSTVLGLAPETVAAVTGSAVANPLNLATTTESHSSTFSGYANNIHIATINDTNYDGTPSGDVSEVYTIAVVQGGGNGTAVLRITSQSGLDDQGMVVYNVNFGSAFTVGSRGLKVTFSEGSSSGNTDNVFVVGQTWNVSVTQHVVAATASSAGTYTGATNTTYIVKVLTGGLSTSATQPQVVVTTTTGVDLSGPTAVTLNTGTYSNYVNVGTQGVQIRFTADALVAGDSFTIPVTAATAGDLKTLILANNLPTALVGAADLDVKLSIQKNVQIPAQVTTGYNWTQSDTEITINEGITATDSSWELAGVPQALPIDTASIYVEHRDCVSTNGNSVGTISDVSEIPTVFASAPIADKDNPLVFGVYNALLNANGQDVKFVGVYSHIGDTVTSTDWATALSMCEGRDDVYNIVPLTYDATVQNLVVAHILAQSAPTVGRWRGCFLNKQVVETLGIYTVDSSNNPLLATIADDTNTSGLQYTIVTTTDGSFITKGVVPGDVVRALYTTDGLGNLVYSSYVVDSVLSNDSLRLVSGPSSPVNVASKIEVWRNLSKDQIAASTAKNPGTFSNRRVKVVWPDVVGNAGVTFPGYFLCAALAGLRSGVLPHQGLTNVAIVGFDDLSKTSPYFSDTQLNVLAASGYWIVTQDPNAGTVYTRHQLTSGDQTDVNQREDSVTTNIDFLSYIFLDRLKVYIGKGNVTPTLINILQGEVLSIIQQYTNTIDALTLGPQIISGKIVQLSQDPAFKDRVICILDLALPAPFNNMELHLVVS